VSGNGGRGALVEEGVGGDRDQQHESFVRLEREIGLLLRRSRAISARLARELHPDLDGAAYGLLALLADTGPLRASDLVARLGLDKSTVSRQVSSLVALGMVDRDPDPADGRAQVLRTSAEGAARLAGIREARRARWEADMSGWPADDVATLAELLARLNRIGEAREAQATGGS
jgi:DNA-binding MarR family transcriptional regulator